MKIDSAGSTRSTAPLRRGERAGAGKPGEFARHLDATGSAGGVTGSSPVNAIDALLALQQVDEEGDATERAQRHGGRILDRLDEIRHGLLTGALSRASLIELSRSVRAERPQVSDPRLGGVLDEIELRAEVELAKFDQDTGG